MIRRAITERFSPGRLRAETVAVLAFGILLAAFFIDAITHSQELSNATGYCIAIALAGLTTSYRLTKALLAAALVLNIPAAIIGAATDLFHWDVIGIENRILAMLAMILVGILTYALQIRIENRRLAKALDVRNRELAERQEVISELVDTISHDLRAPLALLSAGMGRATNGEYGTLPAEYASVLGDSRVSIDDLQQLVETLALLARFEVTGKEPQTERVALATTVNELLSEFRASAQTRGIALVGNVTADATVCASRGDLRRAIANLIANALLYTQRGGRIDVVTACRNDGRAEIIVSDNGFGIDATLRERLFDRGSRGSGGGTGFGLYIVRRVAETAGGSVCYTPREPRGSTFCLSLPSVTG
jgi:signal transduction histidine kinase